MRVPEVSDLHKDIEKITASHLNNIMQLAMFYTGNNEVYAVNVAKIQNFVILDEIDIVPSHDDKSIIIGVSEIRGELVTFVNLDKWLGMPPVDPSLFVVGIVCNLNNKRIGFLVKEIIGIEDKYSHELKTPFARTLKIVYVTKVTIGGVEMPCSVFDIERLIADSGFPAEVPAFVPPEQSSSLSRFENKAVLIAEDSVTAARKLTDFFDSLTIRQELYTDGQALIKRLEVIDADDIGMVVTDLEMPVLDGFQVITYIKNSARLSHIPIVVNSSMTSSGILEKIKRLGVNDFVNKSDTHALFHLVERFMARKEV
ncbi:MAG: chemotaxis protein CheV [Helicobacteraceae bacterium]|jgi:two-component system chemotaxis response regulator CheV|nr:chemotaxis protein CheV [Helicobacteraceae bacterium]